MAVVTKRPIARRRIVGAVASQIVTNLQLTYLNVERCGRLTDAP